MNTDHLASQKDFIDTMLVNASSERVQLMHVNFIVVLRKLRLFMKHNMERGIKDENVPDSIM